MSRFLARYALLGSLSLGGASWYQLGQQELKMIKTSAFDGGVKFSQNFRSWPVWDSIVEPILVKQFTILFGAGHSFILGMASDNEDQTAIQSQIRQMDQEIRKISGDKTSSTYDLVKQLLNKWIEDTI